MIYTVTIRASSFTSREIKEVSKIDSHIDSRGEIVGKIARMPKI